jgi:hypothetical protein
MWRRELPRWGFAIALAVLVGWNRVPLETRSYQAQRGNPGSDVMFEVRTSPDRAGGATNDQITIVFSNTSSEAQKGPPYPFFGDDIIAEFSFSGRDAKPGSAFTFHRFVNDTSFLNARYIRVINHGVDGWAGESISLSVDGRRILERQSMYPRRGGQEGTGIQNYNPGNWYDRSYWEGELQRIRSDRLSGK